MVRFDCGREDFVEDFVEDFASVSSSSGSVFLLFCWRFVLVKLMRGGWMLWLDMLLSGFTKLETQLDNCLAIFHRYIKVSLAMVGPDLDHFMYTGKEKILLRLVEVGVTH